MGASLSNPFGRIYTTTDPFYNVRRQFATGGRPGAGTSAGTVAGGGWGGAGTGGQISSAMERLATSYGKAYGEAKTANEQRYRAMVKLAEQDYKRKALVQRRMLGAVGQTTGQRAADIRAEGAGEQANIMQQLARQGMAGTTVAPTLREGVRRGTSEKLNRLADQMLGTRLGVMRDIAGQDRSKILGIMERRTDAYPNQALLASLIGMIGPGQKGSLLPSTFGALSKMGMS